MAAGKGTASAMLAAGKARAAPAAHPQALPAPPPAPLVPETTRRPVAQYQKAGFFITPDQRQWLKRVVRDAAIEGLSGSDVVRLALARLHADVTDGLDLTDELISQAYREADEFPGRKNRGLPLRGSAST